ncbi:hypothetical protein [Streptomyces sp. H39-S7]|uniref:hypothetical protein n=1 Tax=Streptomyces sp. H39-S7 TaxID=3004357 RepID=UPI0022B0040E|nr:hypothetical protein [Streptomyces sp. H39-S7]MCZ4119870.1 hypothetical protein [Streptomyces sp. H39-S7]
MARTGALPLFLSGAGGPGRPTGRAGPEHRITSLGGPRAPRAAKATTLGQGLLSTVTRTIAATATRAITRDELVAHPAMRQSDAFVPVAVPD